VADTYNNKIKRVSPKDRSSETFVGSGENGMRDGDRATLDEPGGVSVAFGKLYIADTNNHLIRVADLKTRRVETLQINGLEKLRPRKSRKFSGETIELAEQSIEPGEANLTVQLELPPRYKLNKLAPSAVTITSSQEQVASLGAGQSFANPDFPLVIPIKASEGETSIQLGLVVYYCETAKDSLCYFKEARLNLPVKVSKRAGNNKLVAEYKLQLGG
jgi:hypothetical protein